MSKPISYWIAMATCVVLGTALLYLAYLTEISAGGRGFWLFSLFGVSLLLPPGAMAIGALFAEPDKLSSPAVVFAPQWHFVSAIVIVLLIVLVTVISAILS